MLNPMEELTESFHKGADKIFELAQLLQLSLDKIQLIIAKLSDRDSKVKLYEDECDIIQDQLRTYDESFAAAKNCITTYAKKLDTVLSVLTPTIRWLPEQQKMMEMVYQDGTSPWKFTLIHNNSSIETINALLEENFSKGMLQQVTSLSAGDFVCCYERKLLYRASVLGIMPGGRVRVINVDNTSLKIVKKENIFDLTVDLLDIPAQAVQCTLLPQDNEDEKVWSEELNSIFKSTLVECKLTINVLERIETLPPKFVVELYGFNESLEVETNLSDWICKRMLPEVKTLSKNNNNKDDVLGFLKEETVDPYFLTADESQCGLTNGFADLSSASNIIKDNKSKYYTASSKPENSVSEISEDKEKPGRSDRKSRLNGLNDIKKESAETKFNSKNTVSPVKDADQNLNSLSLSPAAKPFEPEKTFLPKSVELLQLSKLPLPTDMPVMVATSVEPSRLESVTSNLHEEYQPQDEYNICSYYKKNRFCWKPSCTKLHKEPTSKKWTDDKVDTYSGIHNALELPKEGEETFLKVLRVLSGHSFYSSLHPNFSNIGEEIVETLDSLSSDMNKSEIIINQYKMLSVDPTLGELVIALSGSKKYQRATIINIDEEVVEVYYPDFGYTEVLPYSNLRKMLPQFLHLPFQAVLTNLANIYTIDDVKGKQFLENLIGGQILKATVVRRRPLELEMEVQLYTFEYVNVNSLLVEKKFCSYYSNR